MKIYKIEISNYRLLKNFSIDLEEQLSLIIGKNNTGKTSILSVLDKFLNEKSKFSYDDLNIDFRKDLEGLVKLVDVPKEFTPKGIKLKIFIEYDDKDDLSNVSRVLMDLDPVNNKIVLGFEYTVSYTDFLKLRSEYELFAVNEKAKVDEKKKSKSRELTDFLRQDLDIYFHLHKMSFEYDMVTNKVNDANFIDLESEGINIKDIIAFKNISARRDVTNKEKENTLSKQTSSLYKKKEDNSDKNQATENFKDQLSETDNTLSDIYKDLFSNVIKKVQDFGGIKLNDTDIAIISTLQHRELLDGNTTVVYTHDDHKLPEHYNGLGYMNLISIIFEIEILVQDFKRDKDKKPADRSAHSRFPFDGSRRDTRISDRVGASLRHPFSHTRLRVADYMVRRESAQTYLGKDRIRHMLSICRKRDPLHQIFSGLLPQHPAILLIPCGMWSVCIIGIDQASI